jgi:uncharacterized protein
MEIKIPIDHERIRQFCEKWMITEFALFGSVLRDDFRPDSDVDVLATFKPDHRGSVFDHMEMEDELQNLFGRHVDLVNKAGLMQSRNKFKKRMIVDSSKVVYVAA